MTAALLVVDLGTDVDQDQRHDGRNGCCAGVGSHRLTLVPVAARHLLLDLTGVRYARYSGPYTGPFGWHAESG
ncbi:MAG: hypothetical protein ACRDTC_14225 [Pseudonocardiaceae bacterium]